MSFLYRTLIMYDEPIYNLIRAFKKLPTVGARTAERFVFHLLRSGKKDVAEMTLALKQVIEHIKSCETCCNFSSTSPCNICTNPKRDRTKICVVAQPQDVVVIEKVGIHNGVYHILRGTISQDFEDKRNSIKIDDLCKRITEEEVTEIILALSPDLPGETTMMFLEKACKKIRPDIAVTKLARGLPMGSDLQYTDDMTLESAFTNRR